MARLRLPLPIFLLVGLLVSPVRGEAPAPTDPAALEFFEKQVRPLLASRCQTCHGASKSKGDLRLDSRASILKGGNNGPAVVPGKPDESLLIDAINYGELYQMPPKSKLPAQEIATLTRWVALGAPWPGPEDVKGGPGPSATPSAFNLRERARHWSFQPVRDAAAPNVKRAEWPRNPIDRFLLAAMESQGLAPAPEADKRTLIRRLTFDLTGLPPTPEEVAAFLADDAPGAYEALVERLLASPHHGERWGRHWLDLVRFAETLGHEFDYDLVSAFRYRDYVVRAFNTDLPYDQFVIEQVAGDRLDPPRRHPTEGFNESVLGTGFYGLGERTHSPVDLHVDEAMRIDNQIDVFSKTFLGLTVACARCHDHKFDAISTHDYYALSGYLKSSRYQHAFIDPPGRNGPAIAAVRAVKDELRSIDGWIKEAEGTAPRPRAPDESSIVFEDFERDGFDGWFVAGDAFGCGPSRRGDWRLGWDGPWPVAEAIAPGQAHSGLVSDRLQGVLRSRTFPIEKRFIHYLASGRKERLNLVIDGFEIIRDPIYGGLTTEVNADEPRWLTQDVGMWIGHRAFIEIADGASMTFTQPRSGYLDGDGFIAVDEIRFSDQPAPPNPPARSASSRVALRTPQDDPALARLREAEAKIAPPTLALAIADGTAEDDRVHVRGNPSTLGETVPRRFLEALTGAEQARPSEGSGRLELARRMVDPSNPLVARVMVNRIWKHHFGEGIVPTPDDFGRMGRPPTHPELLDWLAARFVAEGWSVKAIHRLIVLSSAYRMQSRLDPEAERIDPTNRWLHRMNVRRLEAEALRDALLAVSGRLDPTLFGPSVPIHLTPFMDGRGRPGSSGPLDGDGRRSLYLNVRRNFLSPMLLAFDFPTPATTMGRRNVSNVPAQALTLLNDPFVVAAARLWAGRLLAETPGTSAPRPRIDRLYLTAFGRPPTEAEAAEALAFLAGQEDDPRAWADLCHVLVNVKEFVYVN
jgi:hypothetical protein